MERLPAVLDIRDDLRAARESADRDVDDDVEAVVGRLKEYTERDVGDREGLLDDIDNHLLRLQEQSSDEATAQRFQAARNRIHVFRDSLGGGAAGLAVIDADLTESDAESGAESRLDELRGSDATVHATVVNDGDAGDVVVEAGFYDDANEQVASVASDRFAMDAGDQQTVTLETSVPESADYFTTVARRAGE